VKLRSAILAAVLGALLTGLLAGPAQAGVPPQCTVKPGRFTVSSIPGAHQAVMIDTVAIPCNASIGIVTERVTLVRWRGGSVWTEERMRKYESPAGGPAMHVAFHCNTPGALMGVRVEYRFWQSNVRIATKTYTGRTTALCPR
jgi:hypothetical protein